MTSYIPQHYYGLIPGTYGQLGLVPWPEHLKPRKTDVAKRSERELFQPKAIADGGVVILMLDRRDRIGLATTIERLINLLDAMDGDPDLEPAIGGFLGGGTAHDEREADYWAADDRCGFADCEPSHGWTSDGRGTEGLNGHAYDDDESEEVSDDEYSLGWESGESQAGIGHLSKDYEADLGTTEEIDQVRRLVTLNGWTGQDDEPALGWAESHGKGIIGQQNCLDDREHDDERGLNEDESDFDGGENDTPGFIRGGGSVSQYEDEWEKEGGLC